MLYSADVVCPMVDAPISDGGVLVDGEAVVAVGPAGALRADAAREYHIDGVLLPGLVDGAALLEHHDVARTDAHAGSVDWLTAASVQTRTWDADRWSRSAHRGVQARLRHGTVALFDTVVRGPGVPTASRAGLTGDSFVGVEWADWDHHDAVIAGVRRALGMPAGGRRIGVAPRNPAMVGTGVFQALTALAAETGAPLRTACGQSPHEAEAIFAGRGPLADLARSRGMAFEWLDGGTGMRPVEYLDACGALRPGTSLVHGTGVNGPEAALLGERGVTVVCCPRLDERTAGGAAPLEAYAAPLEAYAAAGVPLALGCGDPTADGDLLAEAAAWARLARERGLSQGQGPGGRCSLDEQAVRLATVDGAAALGWEGRAGTIAVGGRADLVGVAVATTADSVWADLVERGPGRQVLTVVAGVRKARRDGPDAGWPPIDLQEWRAS